MAINSVSTAIVSLSILLLLPSLMAAAVSSETQSKLGDENVVSRSKIHLSATRQDGTPNAHTCSPDHIMADAACSCKIAEQKGIMTPQLRRLCTEAFGDDLGSLDEVCAGFMHGDVLDEQDLLSDIVWCIAGSNASTTQVTVTGTGRTSSVKVTSAPIQYPAPVAHADGATMVTSGRWKIRIGIRIGKVFVGLEISAE